MKILAALLLCSLSCLATNYTAVNSGNWSDPATWGGSGIPGAGDTATCSRAALVLIIDTNTIVGASPAQAGVAALKIANGCAIHLAPNTTLVLYGDLSLDHGSFLISAGSITKFDSSNAVNPFATQYAIRQGAAANHPDTIIAVDPANAPSPSAPALITANVASGANWMWTGAANSMNINLSYTTLQYMGSSVTSGLTYMPGGSLSLTFQNVIFDHTCGVKWSGGARVTDGWYFKNSSFENTYSNCISWYAVTVGSTAPRVVEGVVFDQPPTIQGGSGILYTNSIFLKGYNDAGIFSAQGPLTNSLIVISWQTGSGLSWNGNNGVGIKTFTYDHNILVGDPTTTLVNGIPTAQLALTSGNVNGTPTTTAFTTTLPDSSQHWTAHAFKSSTSAFIAVITGGTGAGQARNIYDNTASVLTLLGSWDTLPDSTSTYAIYNGVLNPHWTNGGNLASGSIAGYTYNIGVLASGGDNNGDFWHSVNSSLGPTCTLFRGPWSPSVSYANHDSIIWGGIYYASMTAANLSNDPSADMGSHWQQATEDSLGSGCATYTFDYTLLLPSIVHDNSGTLITGGLANYKLHHNTYFTGAQSAAFDESRPGTPPFSIREFTGNLEWSEAGKNYVPLGSGTPRASALGPFLIADSGSGGPKTSYVPDFTPATCFDGQSSCMDYNGMFAAFSSGYCASPAGSNQGGSGAYNVRCTSPLGVHDISGDPQFVTRWATPQSWIQFLGIDTSVSDPIQILPDVYSCMMKVNHFAGFNSACTIPNLFSYLWNSYAPQDSTFQAGDADGTDLGAVQVQLQQRPLSMQKR